MTHSAAMSFEVLRRPAEREAGGLALGFELQERALEVAAQLAEHSRELCATTADVRWTPSLQARAPFEDGCGVELALADRSTLWVLLDGRATRALSDALSLLHLGLRGFGELTGAERGLVEFAVLSCVDRLGCGASIRRIVHGRELARIATPTRGLALEFEVRLGASSGSARVLFEVRAASKPLALDADCESALLELRLALPALSIARDSFDALSAGDVLLFGAESFAGFASRTALVTTGGWRVASAQWAADDALSIRVRCGPLEPQVLLAPTPAPGQVLLTPFVGSRALEKTEFERWQSGDELTLDKRPASDVELLASNGTRLGGELVRFSGELGVRVCRIDASPLVCS